MKLKPIRWGPVLVCGRLVILIAAAEITFPPAESRIFSALAVPVLVLMLVWLLMSVVALGFYFYKGWRRVPLVPNKGMYITWMSFESLCALGILGGLVWFFVTPS